MRTALRIGLVALAVGALSVRAEAENLTTYYHVGSWDAFNGPADDGRPICGVGSTNPTDNRSLSLRIKLGTDAVTFQAKKPTWTIPADTQLPVVMQLGLDSPWTIQGVGNGQIVEWTLDRMTMQSFDEQFRRNSSMTLTFPSGNEPPWTIGLNGSMAISNAFARCAADITRAGAQYAAPAPGQAQPDAQGPTQPFTPRQ